MQIAQGNIELIMQANMQKYQIEREKENFIKEQRYAELLNKYNALHLKKNLMHIFFIFFANGVLSPIKYPI